MNAIVKQDTQLPIAQSNATTLLTAIANAASNPAADIDKMERLFAMHEAMVKREAEMAFNAAFSRAQAKMPIVATNATNNQTNSRYAKLAAIVEAIAPIYTAEGFSVSFNNADSPHAGNIRVLAKLSHPAGHSRDYQIDMPPDDVGIKGTANKTKVHAAGSTNAYARRYLTLMIWNLTTEDDEDGQKRHKATPNAGAGDNLTEEQRQGIVAVIVKVREWLDQDSVGDAWYEIENANWDVEEKRYSWSLLTSEQRSTLKAEGARLRKEMAKANPEQATTVIDSATDDKVSDAQVKRLEAIIGKHKLKREDIKLWCSENHNAEHFKDLTKAQYKELDEYIAGIVEFNAQGAI